MYINYNNLIKDIEKTTEVHLKFQKDIDKITQPINEARKTFKKYDERLKHIKNFINSSVFLESIDQLNPLSETVREIIKTKHAFTPQALQGLQGIYGIIDEASITEEKQSKTEPLKDRERDIVRPVFSGVKSQIRRGAVSVKEIIPLSLPKNTKWEDIQMRFVDPHNLFVEIFKHNIKVTIDFNDMGMNNKLSKKPNCQWLTLQGLAKYGEINWNTPIADYKVKKQKQLLAENLRTFFSIEEDPFLLYRKEKAYRLKFNLISENKTPLINENEEYFNDITSAVLDPNKNR